MAAVGKLPPVDWIRTFVGDFCRHVGLVPPLEQLPREGWPADGWWPTFFSAYENNGVTYGGPLPYASRCEPTESKYFGQEGR